MKYEQKLEKIEGRRKVSLLELCLNQELDRIYKQWLKENEDESFCGKSYDRNGVIFFVSCSNFVVGSVVKVL